MCDRSDSDASVNEENHRENAASHPGPQLGEFRRTTCVSEIGYRPCTPRPSADLGDVVPAGSCRLVHIDGAHT